MAAKVTKEMNEGVATLEDFAKSRNDEGTEKGYSIKDVKEKIEELSATITDSKAIVDTSTAEVFDLSPKISDV